MRVISLTHFGVVVLLALLHGSETADKSTGVTVQTDVLPDEFAAADEMEKQEEHEIHSRVARSPWGFRLPKIRWGSNPFRTFRAPRRNIPRIRFGRRTNFARKIKSAARNIARNVNKGVKKIAKNTDKGARAIAKNTDKGARTIAKNADKGARNAARNIDKGARKIGKNVDKGARKILRNVNKGAEHAGRNVKDTIKQLSARAKDSLTKAGQNLRESAKKIKAGEASTTRKIKKMVPTFPKNLQDMLIDYLKGNAEEGDGYGNEDEGNEDEGNEDEGNEEGEENKESTAIPTRTTASHPIKTNPETTESPCYAICQLKKYAEFFQHSYCAFHTVTKRHEYFFTVRNSNSTLTELAQECARASMKAVDYLAMALQNLSVEITSKHDLYKQCANGTMMKCNSGQADNKLLQLKCLQPCEGQGSCVENDKILEEAIDQAIILYNTTAVSFLKLINATNQEE